LPGRGTLSKKRGETSELYFPRGKGAPPVHRGKKMVLGEKENIKNIRFSWGGEKYGSAILGNRKSRKKAKEKEGSSEGGFPRRSKGTSALEPVGPKEGVSD